ncbi:MAG TPA: GNAT family N-acetyltransferase [Longimicrobium sp.]
MSRNDTHRGRQREPPFPVCAWQRAGRAAGPHGIGHAGAGSIPSHESCPGGRFGGTSAPGDGGRRADGRPRDPCPAAAALGRAGAADRGERAGRVPLPGRLRTEHEAGTQRFDGPGEMLLGLYADGALVAVGGVSVDPHEPGPRAGRLRHVYVARARRRRGVGRRLVEALAASARPRFAALTLRTDTPAGARFYESLGVAPVPHHPHHTHRMRLG